MATEQNHASDSRDFQHGDPKPLGMFGAPACRCTTIVLALCVSLCGLVLAGAGACICGFLWHDTTPKILGIALIVLGLVMIFTGFGMYLYDENERKKRLQSSASEMQMQNTEGPTRTHAPPSYDDVLQENVRYRDDPSSSGSSRENRVSYFTAVRTAKVNSTTAV